MSIKRLIAQSLNMSTDKLAQELHDRTTRGIAISDEERALLGDWYARQEQQESALLAGEAGSAEVAALQARVDAALAQVLSVTQRIRTLTAENEALRREIESLHYQLARKASTQPA